MVAVQGGFRVTNTYAIAQTCRVCGAGVLAISILGACTESLRGSPLNGIETEHEERIGVVDLALVMDRSRIGQQAREAWTQELLQHQQILAKAEAELKELERQLKEQAGSATEAEIFRKEVQYRDKQLVYQHLVLKENASIARKHKTLTDKYWGQIHAAIERVAVKRGFAFVINKGHADRIVITVYLAAPLDLTDQVIEELDHQVR